MAKQKQKPSQAPTRHDAGLGPHPEPEMAEAAQEPSTEAPAHAEAMPDDVGPVVAGDEPAATEYLGSIEAAAASMSGTVAIIDEPHMSTMADAPKAYVVIGGGSVKYAGRYYQPGECIPVSEDEAAGLVGCVAAAEG